MHQSRAVVVACWLVVLTGAFRGPQALADEPSAIASDSQLPVAVPLEPCATDTSACLGFDCSDGLLSRFVSPPDHRNSGFLDFNYYWDNRDFNVLTINAGANLPYDFQYFQFVNYTSPLNDPAELENWNDFFTEIHLRRPIASGSRLLGHLDWNVMWADGGFTDEVGRLGIGWRLHDTAGPIGAFVSESLGLQYSVTFHLLEDDGSGWQIEHVYRRNFLDGLVYVAGFADHNINGSARDSDWVAESQIGVKIAGHFYAVAEYRYNSFLPARFRDGWGFGLEYFVPFP
jgi:hypothetical protein